VTHRKDQTRDDPLAELSAEELAVRAKRGGAPGLAAYSELVHRFNPRVYSFLLRRLPAADAEDLAQEAFIRAWQRIDSYNPRYRFSTWLFTIAQRLAISHGRANPRGRTQELGSGAVHVGPQREPGESALRREQQIRIWSMVEEILPPEQQTALWLRYVEEMAIAEIATVLGKSQVGVRVMLFRARAVLAQRLERTDDGVGKVEAEIKPGSEPRKLRGVQCTGGAA
jgi:RNA polymerase sigma-70 factor, ECF subfamily